MEQVLSPSLRGDIAIEQSERGLRSLAEWQRLIPSLPQGFELYIVPTVLLGIGIIILVAILRSRR